KPFSLATRNGQLPAVIGSVPNCSAMGAGVADGAAVAAGATLGAAAAAFGGALGVAAGALATGPQAPSSRAASSSTADHSDRTIRGVACIVSLRQALASQDCVGGQRGAIIRHCFQSLAHDAPVGHPSGRCRRLLPR